MMRDMRKADADTPFAAMIITPRRHFAAAIFASAAMMPFSLFSSPFYFARFLILLSAVVIFISRRDYC
jgi:hypothetical protein